MQSQSFVIQVILQAHRTDQDITVFTEELYYMILVSLVRIFTAQDVLKVFLLKIKEENNSMVFGKHGMALETFVTQRVITVQTLPQCW